MRRLSKSGNPDAAKVGNAARTSQFASNEQPNKVENGENLTSSGRKATEGQVIPEERSMKSGSGTTLFDPEQFSEGMLSSSRKMGGGLIFRNESDYSSFIDPSDSTYRDETERAAEKAEEEARKLQAKIIEEEKRLEQEEARKKAEEQRKKQEELKKKQQEELQRAQAEALAEKKREQSEMARRRIEQQEAEKQAKEQERLRKLEESIILAKKLADDARLFEEEQQRKKALKEKAVQEAVQALKKKKEEIALRIAKAQEQMKQQEEEDEEARVVEEEETRVVEDEEEFLPMQQQEEELLPTAGEEQIQMGPRKHREKVRETKREEIPEQTLEINKPLGRSQAELEEEPTESAKLRNKERELQRLKEEADELSKQKSEEEEEERSKADLLRKQQLYEFEREVNMTEDFESITPLKENLRKKLSSQAELTKIAEEINRIRSEKIREEETTKMRSLKDIEEKKAKIEKMREDYELMKFQEEFDEPVDMKETRKFLKVRVNDTERSRLARFVKEREEQRLAEEQLRMKAAHEAQNKENMKKRMAVYEAQRNQHELEEEISPYEIQDKVDKNGHEGSERDRLALLTAEYLRHQEVEKQSKELLEKETKRLAKLKEDYSTQRVNAEYEADTDEEGPKIRKFLSSCDEKLRLANHAEKVTREREEIQKLRESELKRQEEAQKMLNKLKIYEEYRIAGEYEEPAIIQELDQNLFKILSLNEERARIAESALEQAERNALKETENALSLRKQVYEANRAAMESDDPLEADEDQQKQNYKKSARENEKLAQLVQEMVHDKIAGEQQLLQKKINAYEESRSLKEAEEESAQTLKKADKQVQEKIRLALLAKEAEEKEIAQRIEQERLAQEAEALRKKREKRRTNNTERIGNSCCSYEKAKRV